MIDDEASSAHEALDNAERTVNEVVQTLEGIGTSLSLVWDDMQGESSLDAADMRSLVWMTKGVVESCVERLDSASDLLEHIKELKPYPRPEG